MYPLASDNCFGLDFETYGAVDLFKHGLERYVVDSTFRPLIAAAHFPNGHIRRYDFSDPNQYAHFEAFLGSHEKYYIIAHNAGFEERVLRQMGFVYPSKKFIDSAVCARMMGAAGKLEAAAPQLLNSDKMAAGLQLIKLFSIPSTLQVEAGDLDWIKQLPERYPDEWELFMEYCLLDAELGFRIARLAITRGIYREKEHDNAAITMDMNRTGWHVDIPSVQEMQRRYFENLEGLEATFRSEIPGAADLNLNSLKQLKEWCLARGIKAVSFDEKNTAKLISTIEKKLVSMDPWDTKQGGYADVLTMLKTKRELGGSSLKKLQVILDTTGSDSTLRDQYMHVGAGQTYRTSGRSVQMQNLKRLTEPADMNYLFDDESEWTNDDLAVNLRQVFTARDTSGALIVGDLASIESRGLGWLAGAKWKCEAFAQGKDMYKVLAADIYSKSYDDIVKSERTTGKVGELSCGYGAGGDAVQSFAAGMGVVFEGSEAAELVRNWRKVNPEIVRFWEQLDDALHLALENNQVVRVAAGINMKHSIVIKQAWTPDSLMLLHPSARSMSVEFHDDKGDMVFQRTFHGCYVRGRNIGYYKPTDRKTGPVWKNNYVNPKTKQVEFYSIYGGKLAGIITQSFCREIFFDILRDVRAWLEYHPNVEIVGQFHDEIVLDWWPELDGISLKTVKAGLEGYMIRSNYKGLPMAAEIKHDYRYTK